MPDDPVDRAASDEKQKAMGVAVSQIERQYGKGAIMRLGDRQSLDVPVIPTTSMSVDYALGVGGVPRGRVVEVFGPESSGKTTLALHLVAEAQRRDGVAAFIDAEHALDPEYAKKLGVDVDNLMVSQPDSRRAGARDRRDPHPLGRAGRRRRRLGRGPGPEGRARRRDGRFPRRSPGAPDVPGACAS